jgi:hypothetical protein
MRAVLRHLDASPAFAQILHTFGERSSNTSETNGITAFISSPEQDRVGKCCTCIQLWRHVLTGLDRCYILQCVELHGRSDHTDPWSVRQYAVYERSRQSAKSSEFLLINHTASQSLSQRLKAIRNGTVEAPTSSTSVHLILVSSAIMQWSHYCNFLEEQLNQLVRRSTSQQDAIVLCCVLTSLQNNKASIDPATRRQTGLGLPAVIDFQDLQILHTAQRKIQVTHSAVKTNIFVIGTISRDFENRRATSSQSFATCLSSLESQLQRVEALLARSSTLAIHVGHVYKSAYICQSY